MKTAPYQCHIFVCVNDRQGARKSCADGSSAELRLRLKERIAACGFPPGTVRVSQSLCLGLCSEGPNVVIYPQNLHFPAVGPDDVEIIVTKVRELLQEEEARHRT